MNLVAAHILYDNEESWSVEAEDIAKRYTIASNIINRISMSGCQIGLVVFPAGFLISTDHEQCISLANDFVASLPARNYTVSFGIDHKISGLKAKESTSGFAHGFVVESSGEKPIWGITQLGLGHEDRVSESAATHGRVFNVESFSVGLLMCGEMTTKVDDIQGNPRMSEILAKKSDLLINLTHEDRQIQPPNISWFPAMQKTGRPCVLAENFWREYLTNGSYCQNANAGPDYSHMLEIIKSEVTPEFCLKYYSSTLSS